MLALVLLCIGMCVGVSRVMYSGGGCVVRGAV